MSSYFCEKVLPFSVLMVQLCTFLASPRKVPKESDLKGAELIAPAIKAAPLGKPQRALTIALEHLNLNPVQVKNVPIFYLKGNCCVVSKISPAGRTSWNSPP